LEGRGEEMNEVDVGERYEWKRNRKGMGGVAKATERRVLFGDCLHL